ncbi:MAG: ATP-binding cassette domain-containing protein [Clostridiales bacterium]|nr:ATP-binding cassette domain-containing protein [Clostridiales bacterium]
MIEVRNLVKQYGDHLAVDHLSFTVKKGQIYGFLGPNGAGKSTTMNIMTGYIGATEGQVIINGHDIMEEPEEAKKCIGYLPELPPLYIDMTVKEYLTFAADLKKVPRAKIKESVTKAMELTGLTAMQKRLIRNLSKGYRQRVGLAQAIISMPEIIILDEPTVGLDPAQIIEIRDLIKNLAKEHTVILSSHILSEVSAVCDHILIIAHGKLVASDTPENLEKMMQGYTTLELTAKATKSEIESILSDYDCIKELSFKSVTEDGATSFNIKTDIDVDLREQLFYTFAQHHYPLLQLQQVTVSLEDVFLRLTSQADDEAETKALQENINLAPVKEENNDLLADENAAVSTDAETKEEDNKEED